MTFLLRFGAICGVLCGALTALPAVVEAFAGETAPTSFLIGLSPAFAPAALTALYLAQTHVGRRLSTAGYAVNLIGVALFGGAAFTLNMALFYLDDATVEDLLAGPTRVALLGSALVFVVGTVLFGLSMIRARVHPVPAAAGYTAGFALLALLAPLPDSPLTSAVHVLAGGSLVWLSLGLIGDRSGSIEADPGRRHRVPTRALDRAAASAVPRS